jgi:hypothetical protein
LARLYEDSAAKAAPIILTEADEFNVEKEAALNSLNKAAMDGERSKDEN